MAFVAEIRAYKTEAWFILRMVEISFGIIGVVAIPSRFWGATVVSRVALSWTMVYVSLLMCLLAMVSKYASKVALKFVFVGNAFLACLWYLNGAYHH
jgi:hypothetical protein